ncbi:hypothetical protein PanWU01x14_112530, partial [Parasponia andersonii]
FLFKATPLFAFSSSLYVYEAISYLFILFMVSLFDLFMLTWISSSSSLFFLFYFWFLRVPKMGIFLGLSNILERSPQNMKHYKANPYYLTSCRRFEPSINFNYHSC